MPRAIPILDKGLDALCWFHQQICVALLVAMLAINTANIGWRGLQGSALNWVWPWTMVLFLWWAMLAFYPLYRSRKDVSIYILLTYLPAPARRALGCFVHLAVFAASAVLIYTGPERLQAARGTIELVGLPRWTLAAPLILSAVPIAVDALLAFARIASGREDYQPFGMIEVEQ